MTEVPETVCTTPSRASVDDNRATVPGTADTLPASPCPVLDLGVKYPRGDLRDPWRRMPALFQAARSVFGSGMFNNDGRLRLRVEQLMGRYCSRQRTAYGPCTRKRSQVCQCILLKAVEHGREGGSTPQQKLAYAQAELARTVTSDETDRKLKATVVKADLGKLRMPPITFQEPPRV